MIRITALPYLNCVPFVYGLKQSFITHQISLSLSTPDQTAHQLQNDLCDLAIVPVAAIPTLPRYQIIGNHCIGAISAVASVLLCSQVPIEQIHEVALDQESRTSVLLVRLLLHNYWHVMPHYVPLPDSFPKNAPESVLLIGDKALLHSSLYPYVYDLAQHWIMWTGKPFVFAAWVTNKTLSEDFVLLFDQALTYGVTHIDEAITSEVRYRFPKTMAKEYLTGNLSFSLDQEKLEGLHLFWKFCIDAINRVYTTMQ